MLDGTRGTGGARIALTRWHIFGVTWLAYAGFYLCRKNFSVVMPALEQGGLFTKLQLADFVFAYSLAYSLGQLLAGPLADRLRPRVTVAAGMGLSVAANLVMPQAIVYLPLVLLSFLNGLGQAAGWPGLVKNMGTWFDAKQRGVVMAWWSTNYVLGGFLATVLATRIVTTAGWKAGLWVPALPLAAILVVFVLFDRDGPGAEAVRSSARRVYWELLRQPVVWVVAITAALLKVTRYSFLFWLPLYMTGHLRYSLEQAGYISSLYELVGFGGAVLAGYLSDRVFGSRRFPVACLMQAGLAAALLWQPTAAAAGPLWSAIGISLIGILTFGPDTLMQGACAQDAGGATAGGTASGFISGMASVGQLISPYLVAWWASTNGWDALFRVFVVLALAGSALTAFQWRYRALA
ncbi:MAG: MFS transporter [Bryobacteraceae bacterium]|nr:MFS transporter [Bryobacteraceae bacterium]